MTAPDTVTKTTGLAMYAVAAFMLDGRLPSPVGIRAPMRCPEVPTDRVVRVDVYADDLETWVQATGADYLSTETSTDSDGARFVSVSFAGSVASAIGDIAVIIRTAQHVDALTLIPGGVA